MTEWVAFGIALPPFVVVFAVFIIGWNHVAVFVVFFELIGRIAWKTADEIAFVLDTELTER